MIEADMNDSTPLRNIQKEKDEVYEEVEDDSKITHNGERIEEVELFETIDENDRERGRSDGDSVATTKVDNINRIRLGLIVTIPSSKELYKRLALQLQKWFSKMK